MAAISNPSTAVKIGYGGVTLSGFFLQDYNMTPLGDMEPVSADGRVLCYITTNPGKQYKVTFLVSAASTPNTGNLEPPKKGQTVSLTVPTTSTLPVESSATTAAIEMICMDSGLSRTPGAVKMEMTLNWHPAADNDANPMDFNSSGAYVSSS